jgi:hypothetical protein
VFRSSPRLASLLLAGLSCFLAPGSLAGQGSGSGEPLTGRVTMEGEGVGGAEVELHSVTQAASGVVMTTRSAPDGAFRFDLPPVDTAGFTVFFATARHHDVRYFGRPLHASDPRDGYTLEVFDTTSAPAEPVRLARRDVVLIPQGDGGWEVNEIVRLHNPGRRTVVSASGMPTAEVSIPERAEAFEAGDGDAPADNVQRMGQRILLLMPLLPGDRELFFRYRVSGRPAAMELGASTPADTMNLFVRQPAPTLTVGGMEPMELIRIEDERFLQYAATGMQREAVTVQWRGATAPPVNPVTAAVVIALLVLAVGGWAAYRNRPAS